MQKFIDKIKIVSEKIYDEIGCINETLLQTALSIELDKLKIPHLRETSIQIYYDGHPLGFLELDFVVSPHDDLKEHLIIEMKLASKIDDTSRQQLKTQLRSAPLNKLIACIFFLFIRESTKYNIFTRNKLRTKFRPRTAKNL